MILQKFSKKFSTLRKVLSFVYGKHAIIAVFRDFLFIVSTAAEIYSITVLGKFIDSTTQILINWDSFNLKDYITTDSFKFLILIFLLWTIVQVCSQIRSYLYTTIYEKVWSSSQAMMISKVASSNLQDVERKEFQDDLTFSPAFSIPRIIDVYDNFSIILSNSVRFISAIVIISQSMGLSSLFILLFVLPEALVIHSRRKKIREYQDNEVGKLKFLGYIQNLALTISNFLELRVNNIYSFLRRRYEEEYNEYLGGYFKNQYSFYKHKATFGILTQLFKYLYIIYVLAISVTKKLSFGTFKALYDYVDVANTSIFNVVNSISLISTNLGYIDRFFDLIEYQGFGDEYHGKERLRKGTPKLEFKNLNFAYPDDPDVRILKNLNIVVNPGEKIAFFGGDGSGKSTTVKILTGLYGVNDGEYMLDGISTKELDRGQLKKRIAVVLQDFINYHFSLKENVVISGQRKNVNAPLYDDVIKITGVEKFMKEIHIDHSALLGKTFPSGRDLSPGYWQRLAISRMLYRNKDIYIMDEPFTYIDDMSAERILDGIMRFLGDDRSMIYITRSTNFLDKFDRIYYLDKGKIVEFGSWNELMKKKGKLYMDSVSEKGNMPD